MLTQENYSDCRAGTHLLYLTLHFELLLLFTLLLGVLSLVPHLFMHYPMFGVGICHPSFTPTPSLLFDKQKLKMVLFVFTFIRQHASKINKKNQSDYCLNAKTPPHLYIGYLEIYDYLSVSSTLLAGSSRGIVVNALDYVIEVRDLELQAGYDIHFWTNALWKCMNFLIPLAKG